MSAEEVAATAADHAREAELLLEDVAALVRDSPRHHWGSQHVANMIAAAQVHAALADLKTN